MVEADLKAYFDKMGEITDIVVMKGEGTLIRKLVRCSIITDLYFNR